MNVLASKWFVLISIAVLALVVLYLIGKKSVHSEVVIPASPKQVWSVLMDTENYYKWNEVLVPLDGKLEQGQGVTYRFTQEPGNDYEMASSVKQVVANQRLNQGGGTVGILTFDHHYILEAVDGGTKVIIHEDYSGIAVPFWNPTPVQKAYERLNQALKQRVIEVSSGD